MDSPEGFYTSITEKPKDINEYQEKANPVLKEHGKQIVSKKQFDFMKALIGVLIAGIVVFSYISLSGGALIQYISGGKLPGLEAIEIKKALRGYSDLCFEL